jgi:acetyltransferase-like isoleucine patch superfamily enzyme
MAVPIMIRRAQRLWWTLWPARWWRSIKALSRGVRLHPGATLLGRSAQFVLGRGTVVGAAVRLDAGNTGFIEVGEKVWLARHTELQSSTRVRIGAGTTVQRNCSINGSVTLGRDCIVAPNVFISSGTHPFRAEPHLAMREQEQLGAMPERPVRIQDDCWLGVNAVVCPGVTIGKGSVIGANAVVTKDVPPYSVAAGVPATVVGQRLQWCPPHSIESDRAEDMVYVLSGHERKGSASARGSMGVSADEPLLAVMAGGGRRVRVRFVASEDLDLRAGDAVRRLSAGQGVLDLDVDTQGYGGTIVELAAAGWARSARLEVLSLTAVESQGAARGA